ncbi:translation factor [Rickenella mellea]|uniref:Threonylcarbamoyl-AMP synthase n=1 Tax=Rickenella mellea TaxID=50990 RepID=A0A4R5XI42_9AGAM|nr:translation factor [Rickenella mellea]
MSPIRVFHCDPSSVSFPSSASEPKFASPSAFKSLKTAASILTHPTDPSLVAFPTETVYGLGASALSSSAVSQIFRMKGRPADNPLIVHISSASMLNAILPASYTIPPTYEKLMKAFWPGALTLLFPADKAKVPDVVRAGKDTVAVRMPDHPIARALIELAGVPLAAPSANSSGKPSPTRAEHIVSDLGERGVGEELVVLDGGKCEIGVESTVVDGLNVEADGVLKVLRPGGVTVEDIERVLREDGNGDDESATRTNGDCHEHIRGNGVKTLKQHVRVLVHKRDYTDTALESAPTTPGMKYRHYSPNVPVVLLMITPSPAGQTPIGLSKIAESYSHLCRNSVDPLKIGLLAPSDSVLFSILSPSDKSQAKYSIEPHPLGPTTNPSLIASNLFDGLISLDKSGVDVIFVEGVSEEREGLAVMNRVTKAAGEVRWVNLDD